MKNNKFSKTMQDDLIQKINNGLAMKKQGGMAFAQVKLDGVRVNLQFDINSKQIKVYS